MKYIVVLGDGMADRKIASIGDKTPLMKAVKPNIDRLAALGEVGLCKSIPDGMKPGSDTANLSILGYNPRQYYTGRSPLEAVSIGIDLKETDVTLRCNLVTLSDEEKYEDKTMLDYSAGEISTAEASELIKFLAQNLDDEEFKFYAGVSYRHCLVVKDGKTGHDLTPPHDISDKKIAAHLPKGEYGEKYLNLMKKSEKLLKGHPINTARIKAGKNPATSIWLWGEGTKPMLSDFQKKTGLKGGIISAVDLIKGIGILAGLKIIEVEGATGNYDTNFKGKALAALENLKAGLDFVYIHMEAPDECGHRGELDKKIYSIEQIDSQVVKTIADELDNTGEDYAMLICPDHPTPISIKTHTSDPIPYLLYRSGRNMGGKAKSYDEDSAALSGAFVEEGYKLIDRLLALK